jgi:hypothetical protein
MLLPLSLLLVKFFQSILCTGGHIIVGVSGVFAGLHPTHGVQWGEYDYCCFASRAYCALV